MVITIYIDPDGTEYDMLPRKYKDTSPVTEAWALAHGWAKEERVIPDQPEVHLYSKLRLYDALVHTGIWEQVRAAIEAAGQWERWEWAIELATDYEPFAQLLVQLRQTFGDELTDNILSQAEI